MTETHEGGMPPHEVKKGQEREWKEVPRPYEVAAIGDLNGSFFTFIKSVINLGYAKVESRDEHEFTVDTIEDSDEASVETFFSNYNLVWTGGNKRLVFLGDIVGDRQGWGGTILEGIEQLQGQARQEGGEIITLAGNHDIYALMMFIYGNHYDMKINPLQCHIRELDRYETTRMPKYLEVGTQRTVVEVPHCTYNKEKYLADPKIVALIERMKKMDVIACIDDTLMTHADFEEQDFFDDYKDFEKILFADTGSSVSVQEVVSAMNKKFHENLYKIFQIEVAEDGSKKVKINQSGINEFKHDCGLFIGTLSGWPACRKMRQYTDEFKDFLKEKGINLFVHGHTTVEYKNKQDFVLSLSPEVGMGFETTGDYSNTAKILADDAGNNKGSIEVGIEKDLWNTVRSS